MPDDEHALRIGLVRSMRADVLAQDAAIAQAQRLVNEEVRTLMVPDGTLVDVALVDGAVHVMDDHGIVYRYAAPTVRLVDGVPVLLVPDGTRVERLPGGVVRYTSAPPGIYSPAAIRAEQDRRRVQTLIESGLITPEEMAALQAEATTHIGTLSAFAEGIQPTEVHTVCLGDQSEACHEGCPGFALWSRRNKAYADASLAKEPEPAPRTCWARLLDDDD